MQSIDPKQISDNLISLISKEWMLVTAGNATSFNTMTAAWEPWDTSGIVRLHSSSSARNATPMNLSNATTALRCHFSVRNTAKPTRYAVPTPAATWIKFKPLTCIRQQLLQGL